MVTGSYLLLSNGMNVQDADGNVLGHISDVVADETADIFRGIVVSTGFLSHKIFVSGEHVVSVSSGLAIVDLTLEQLNTLPDASDLAVRTVE